jgi:deoxyribonuclease-2
MLVQTWRNGAKDNEMPSNCSRTAPQVFNVDCTTVSALGGYSFRYTKDHSKWGVVKSGADVACVGDINRQFSQEKRGGGSVCFKSNKKVWSAYRGLVSDSCQAACGA